MKSNRVAAPATTVIHIPNEWPALGRPLHFDDILINMRLELTLL